VGGVPNQTQPVTLKKTQSVTHPPGGPGSLATKQWYVWDSRTVPSVGTQATENRHSGRERLRSEVTGGVKTMTVIFSESREKKSPRRIESCPAASPPFPHATGTANSSRSKTVGGTSSAKPGSGYDPKQMRVPLSPPPKGGVSQALIQVHIIQTKSRGAPVAHGLRGGGDVFAANSRIPVLPHDRTSFTFYRPEALRQCAGTKNGGYKIRRGYQEVFRPIPVPRGCVPAAPARMESRSSLWGGAGSTIVDTVAAGPAAGGRENTERRGDIHECRFCIVKNRCINMFWGFRKRKPDLESQGGVGWTEFGNSASLESHLHDRTKN